ncbi:MAG TPA: ion channel [Bacteroidales bacterium]|nr:ion channel [Bacteroidales bacterium]
MSSIDRLLQNRRYWILFFSLLALIVLPAFMNTIVYTNVLFRITFSLVFFTSVSAVMTGRRLILFGFSLALVAALMQWLSDFFRDETHLFITISILYLAFYVYIIHRLFLVIIKSQKVNLDVIVISVSIYLIAGIIFAVICSTLDKIYTGAYTEMAVTGPHIYEFVYYSFITMATVGYGDIVPKIPETRALAVLIGITGQLYMTVIVAILVGKFLQQSSE